MSKILDHYTAPAPPVVFAVGDRVIVQAQSVGIIEKIINRHTVIVRSEATGQSVTVMQGDLIKLSNDS